MEAENIELLEDPVLRHLFGFWVPQAYLALPWEEQRWRGRVFLIAITITGDASGGAVALGWHMALTADHEAATDNRRLVEATPDEAILAGLQALRDG